MRVKEGKKMEEKIAGQEEGWRNVEGYSGWGYDTKITQNIEDSTQWKSWVSIPSWNKLYNVDVSDITMSAAKALYLQAGVVSSDMYSDGWWIGFIHEDRRESNPKKAIQEHYRVFIDGLSKIEEVKLYIDTDFADIGGLGSKVVEIKNSENLAAMLRHQRFNMRSRMEADKYRFDRLSREADAEVRRAGKLKEDFLTNHWDVISGEFCEALYPLGRKGK